MAKSRLPGCPSYLHGVVRVLVVEDQGLLDELVVALQLVNVVLVVDDVVLVLLQLVHLVLQGPRDLDGAPSNLLCVGYGGALLVGEPRAQRDREWASGFVPGAIFTSGSPRHWMFPDRQLWSHRSEHRLSSSSDTRTLGFGEGGEAHKVEFMSV